MSRLTRDEAITRLTAYIGDRNDDDSIALLEDISDSLTEDSEDWKAKYEELDASWRKRYIERFSNLAPEDDLSEVIETEQESATEDTEVVDESEELTIDDLYEKED